MHESIDNRFLTSWWLDIAFNVSVSQSIDYLLERHPLVDVVDRNFTRPLVPYDCQAMVGGCGGGILRTPDPNRSCSIHMRSNLTAWKEYKWNWFYD